MARRDSESVRFSALGVIQDPRSWKERDRFSSTHAASQLRNGYRGSAKLPGLSENPKPVKKITEAEKASICDI